MDQLGNGFVTVGQIHLKTSVDTDIIRGILYALNEAGALVGKKHGMGYKYRLNPDKINKQATKQVKPPRTPKEQRRKGWNPIVDR